MTEPFVRSLNYVCKLTITTTPACSVPCLMMSEYRHVDCLSDSQENQCIFTRDFMRETRPISTKQMPQTNTNHIALVSVQ